MQPKFKLIVCEGKELYNQKGEGKLNNQHDKLFKDLFNDKDEVKNFLKNYIKINIKDAEVEKCSNSYVSSNYKNYEADIVYKIRDKNIFFLIEHQSTVDERMPYRILNYSMEILKEEIDINKARNKDYDYPLIIPIVLYTGKRLWKVKKNFSEKIKESNNNEKYIEMKYELVDVNKYTEDELLSNDTVISYAMLIEKSKEKEKLIETLNKISEVSNNAEVNKKMVKIIQYILAPILQEDTQNVAEKFKIKEEWTMKTLQDYFLAEWTKLKKEKMEEGRKAGVKMGIVEGRKKGIREGKKEGIKEGIREGKKEGIKEGRKEGIREGRKEGMREGMKIVVLNMARNKVNIEEIKKYTGMEEEEIQEIVANM